MKRGAVKYPFGETWMLPGSRALELHEETQRGSEKDRKEARLKLQEHMKRLDADGRARGEFPLPLWCYIDGQQPHNCRCGFGQCEKGLIL